MISSSYKWLLDVSFRFICYSEPDFSCYKNANAIGQTRKWWFLSVIIMRTYLVHLVFFLKLLPQIGIQSEEGCKSLRNPFQSVTSHKIAYQFNAAVEPTNQRRENSNYPITKVSNSQDLLNLSRFEPEFGQFTHYSRISPWKYQNFGPFQPSNDLHN